MSLGQALAGRCTRQGCQTGALAVSLRLNSIEGPSIVLQSSVSDPSGSVAPTLPGGSPSPPFPPPVPRIRSFPPLHPFPAVEIPGTPPFRCATIFPLSLRLRPRDRGGGGALTLLLRRYAERSVNFKF